MSSKVLPDELSKGLPPQAQPQRTDEDLESAKEPVASPGQDIGAEKLSQRSEGAAPRRSSVSHRRSITQSLVLVDHDSGGQYAGMVKTPEDEIFVNKVLNNDNSAFMGMSKPAHLGETKWERAMLVLKQFPMHCLKMQLMCIIPILAGCVPILLGAVHANEIAKTIEFADVSATYKDFEDLTYARMPHSVFLEALVSTINNMSLYIMFFGTLCCLYDWRVVFSCIKRISLPLASGHIFFGCIVSQNQRKSDLAQSKSLDQRLPTSEASLMSTKLA